jgi:hypothetical protein
MPSVAYMLEAEGWQEHEESCGERLLIQHFYCNQWILIRLWWDMSLAFHRLPAQRQRLGEL